MCGDYAGAGAVFSQTCDGFCYQDYVLGDPSRYTDAFFEVQYVQVYGLAHEDTVVESSAAPALFGATGWCAVLVGAVGAVVGLVW